ncbi:MAG: hypothetical protein JWQ38_2859 [Flavipsychrobacter sp.]|nr:hypothetical protein [Flavipsychrobacter sp.]
MAKFGDKPGSVLVDLGLMPTAPDSRYPYLVVTGPKVQKCNKQGLPGKDEIAALEEVLDVTGNFITGVTAKVLAGTLTYDCKRLNYYYVKDTTGLRNALTRMYSRSFPGYGYNISMSLDKEWTEYKTFLYPSDATFNWMENNKLITKMKEGGDSLSKPRNIAFELYFRADTSRSAVAAFATAKGYSTEQLMNAKATNAPYQLIVSKYTQVKIDTITVMSTELKKEAAKHHGYYNGWEAKK